MVATKGDQAKVTQEEESLALSVTSTMNIWIITVAAIP